MRSVGPVHLADNRRQGLGSPFNSTLHQVVHLIVLLASCTLSVACLLAYISALNTAFNYSFIRLSCFNIYPQLFFLSRLDLSPKFCTYYTFAKTSSLDTIFQPIRFSSFFGSTNFKGFQCSFLHLIGLRFTSIQRHTPRRF